VARYLRIPRTAPAARSRSAHHEAARTSVIPMRMRVGRGGRARGGRRSHDLRDDEGQQEHHDEGGHDRHQERVGERGADPVPRPGLLLEVVGEAGEGERERSALLPGPHHAGIEVRERLGVGLHGARQRRPAANGFQQVDEDLPALRVVHLGRHRLQGADERDARPQKRRELPGQERKEIRLRRREGRNRPCARAAPPSG